MMTDLTTLQSLPTLAQASPAALANLFARGKTVRFDAGSFLMQEGSPGREMYLLLAGRVEVYKGEGADAVKLGERAAGELVGEMGVIDGSPRSATLRALTPVEALAFTGDDMPAWMGDAVLLNLLLHGLSSRLRNSQMLMIADLTRKNAELARMYRELQEAQASLVEKERMEHELSLARDLQQSILPHEFAPVPAVDFAARYRPAREVGGDVYDVIPLKGGCAGLFVADISDKGIPAALYMALARSLIRAEARRSASPRQVLRNTHRLLGEISQAEMFLTAFYGVLDPAAGAFTYVRAGHDYPLHYSARACQIEFLRGRGMLIGPFDDLDLEEVRVGVGPGDALILYTDGITEASDPAGEPFGDERLVAAALTGRDLDAQGLCDAVFDAATAFQFGGPQADDMAVLVARLA
jgi:phosphoserine phosphatase RsbU/P